MSLLVWSSSSSLVWVMVLATFLLPALHSSQGFIHSLADIFIHPNWDSSVCFPSIQKVEKPPLKRRRPATGHTSFSFPLASAGVPNNGAKDGQRRTITCPSAAHLPRHLLSL